MKSEKEITIDKMYARSPKSFSNSLQVPTTKRYTIQPMDGSKLSGTSDDDEEYGLGYQNTLVSFTFNHFLPIQIEWKERAVSSEYFVHICHKEKLVS